MKKIILLMSMLVFLTVNANAEIPKGCERENFSWDDCRASVEVEALAKEEGYEQELYLSTWCESGLDPACYELEVLCIEGHHSRACRTAIKVSGKACEEGDRDACILWEDLKQKRPYFTPKTYTEIKKEK